MHSEREDSMGEIALKNLKTGEQVTAPFDQICISVERILHQNQQALDNI